MRLNGIDSDFADCLDMRLRVLSFSGVLFWNRIGGDYDQSDDRRNDD